MNTFAQNLTLRSSDCARCHLLDWPHLQALLQDLSHCAYRAERARGIWKQEQDFAFVLAEQRIRVCANLSCLEHLLREGQTLHLETDLLGMKGSRLWRAHRIQDEGGQLLFQALQVWTPVQLDTRRPLRLEPLYLGSQEGLTDEIDSVLPELFSFKPEWRGDEAERPLRQDPVRYVELDHQEHMNNVHFLCRILNEEARRLKGDFPDPFLGIRALTIRYRASLYWDDPIELTYRLSSDQASVEYDMQSQGRLVCQMMLQRGGQDAAL